MDKPKLFLRKSSRRFAVVAACAFGLLLVSQFQNCGDMGGPGLGGVINGPSTCAPNSPGCASVGGNPTLLKVSVTNATNTGNVKKLTISASETTVGIEGSCNKGGFARARIVWTLKKDGAVLKSGRNAYCNEIDGDGQFTASLTGLTLVKNNDYALEVTIAGLDSFDNETFGAAKSNVVVEARDILLNPKFDSRACNAACANTSPNWKIANKSDIANDPNDETYYIFNNGNGSVTYQVGTGVTPPLRGFCQRRGAANIRVQINIDRVGLPNNGIDKTAALADLPCNPFTGTRPSGVSADYDGIFDSPPIAVNFDPVRQSWHGRLYVTSNDPLNPTADISSRTGQHIETHFRFQSGGGGRNWTVPIARSALRRWKTFATLSNVPDSAELDANANVVVQSVRGQAATQSLRKYVLANYFKMPETTVVGNLQMPKAYIAVNTLPDTNLMQTDNWAGLLSAIATGQRRCDPSVSGGDITDIPNFTNGGVTRDLNNIEAQMARLSICLVYWFYHGYLGRGAADNRPDAGSDWLGILIKDGMYYELNDPDQVYCYTNVQNGFNTPWGKRFDPGRTGDPSPCDYMRPADGNSWVTFIRAQRTRLAPTVTTLNPAAASAAQKRALLRFYGAIAQRYTNWLGGGFCESRGTATDGVGELTRIILNGALPYVVDEFKNNQVSSGLMVYEDNGYGDNYKSWDVPGATTCFSEDQDGWNNPGYTSL
ncbi:MAG: hypothetical protein ABL958_08335 [Bdellovibrionia bacterium]